MRNLYFLALIVTLHACSGNQNPATSENNPDLDDRVKNNKDTSLTTSDKYKVENTKIEFDEPIVLGSAENIAIPIILDDIYEDKITIEHSFFNIAIIDSSNSFKRLLFDESVVINSIVSIEKKMPHYQSYWRGDDEEELFSSYYNSLLFLEVTEFSDGKSSDRHQLYVYNLKKDKLNRLTPAKTDLVTWKLYRDQSKIIITISLDSNNDGKFDDEDDENVLILDPNQPEEKHPLFELDILKEIKLKVLNKNKMESS